MLAVVFLAIFLSLINSVIFSLYKRRHSFFNVKMMNWLYLYHSFFFLVYYTYAQFNLSDSHRYYLNITENYSNWFQAFGTDTKFIHFLGYPFFKLGFTYEMLMFLFSWFGYLGFVYAYLFFREKIPMKIKVFKSLDFLTLILFFPNMHFWSASLGKGAPIFMGLMMFAYGILQPKKRLFLLVLASTVIFYIRPHVFMFVAVGTVIGYFSGRDKISAWKKILVSGLMLGALILVQDKILAVVDLQGSDDLIEDFGEFSEIRSEDLSSAGSGVDMSTYPLPLKLFTFWFRPLFLDAPNMLGIITSVENLAYLLLFLKIIKKDFIKFLRKAPSAVKMSFVIFFTTSLAMTFVMSNLGIIMRQKTMVMYFLFFVIYYYLAQKKYTRLLKLKKRKLLLKKQRELALV